MKDKRSITGRRHIASALILCLLSLILLPPGAASAETAFSGHLKYFLNLAGFPDDSVFTTDSGRYTEQLGNMRLMARSRSGPWSAEADYVMNALYNEDLVSCGIRGTLAARGCERLFSDRDQLFDLSTVLATENDAMLAQRIDRLWLAWSSEKIVARAGRQAVSWGNGMVYNTLDLFNPFAPDAIDTEYKRGQDMLYLQGLFANGNDVQVLVVPRRDPVSGRPGRDASSMAAKWHGFGERTELELMAASHYGDGIIGAAITAALGDNVANVNFTVTHTENETVLSAVANYTFTGIVRDHNLNGFIEFFYNGFGLAGKRHDIEDLIADTGLYDRLQRGELYTIGRYYLAAGILYEATPLLSLTPTLFVNLGDGSGMLQFMLDWSIAQNLDLLAGLKLPAGPAGSEFGGLRVNGSGEVLLTPPELLFARLAWYF